MGGKSSPFTVIVGKVETEVILYYAKREQRKLSGYDKFGSRFILVRDVYESCPPSPLFSSALLFQTPSHETDYMHTVPCKSERERKRHVD